MPRTLPYTVVSQLCRARAEAVFFTSPPSRVEIRKVYKLSKCQGCQASGFIDEDEVPLYSSLSRSSLVSLVSPLFDAPKGEEIRVNPKLTPVIHKAPRSRECRGNPTKRRWQNCAIRRPDRRKKKIT